MCHRANDARAWQCDCGYEFGQTVDKVIELLHAQRRRSRISLSIFLGLDAVTVGAVAFSALKGVVIMPGLLLTAMTYWTFRSVQRLRITSESLRQLEAKTLPVAKLLKD
jgi:hypothetical protein